MRTTTMLGKIGLAVLCGIGLAGCAGAPVSLGQDSGVKYDTTRPREITGRGCGIQLMLFFPVASNDRQRRAYDELKRNAGNDYIADITVTEEWTYIFVGTRYCTHMTAKAYPRLRT